MMCEHAVKSYSLATKKWRVACGVALNASSTWVLSNNTKWCQTEEEIEEMASRACPDFAEKFIESLYAEHDDKRF